ncbi:hypothetical protein SDC9_203860 [bioreactor metagenome]|uniref:Uncharacterized protein n=1 Tax=bioreactor metagenome TaxID=1076179 RepID=A0A645J6S6_9ZZZZ
MRDGGGGKQERKRPLRMSLAENPYGVQIGKPDSGPRAIDQQYIQVIRTDLHYPVRGTPAGIDAF